MDTPSPLRKGWGEGLFRSTRRRLLTLCLFVAPLLPAAADDPYLADLQTRADELRLHEQRYWHILLHYERGLLGTRSNVDDPSFFFAGNGKTDSRAELQATLAAFFRPPTDDELDHPVCKFIARYTWLREQLGIDPDQLPVPECEPYRRVSTNMNATAATLIFPSAHMNRPASMFGHTAIVFDTEDRNRLLAKAVNYAASTTEGFGPFFAFAGIAGWYKGYYSIDTYADKVEEYNDIDQRDVWEYELDFTVEEVDLILRHIWELQTTYSQYYFFTENCAYNLLYLLEAGRPSLRLSNQFKAWVIPIDTVKAVRQAGLIRDITYRPSKTTTLKHLVRQLPDPTREQALALAQGETTPDKVLSGITNRAEQIVVMDLAAEFCQYEYATGTLDVDHYRPRFLNLLRARSKLGTSEENTYSAPTPSHPEEGHDAGRVALGIGTMEHEPFLSLRLRPAHHELSDTLHGFDLGSHLQFAPFEGRFLLQEDRFEIERIDLLDILSISPRDRLFKPVSWKIRTGARQVKFHGVEDNLLAYLSTGSGRAVATPGDGLVAAMVETDILAGGSLDSDYSAGIGASFTWLPPPVGRWHGVLQARAMTYPLGQDFFAYRVTCTQNLAMGRNQSLSLHLSHDVNDNHAVQQAELACRFYF